MAKGQQRSNREKKKPKQTKSAPSGGTSQFSQPPSKSAPSAGKKR